MFTVALVGPDGAGKTTVARELVRRLPVPTTYLYMGVSLDSSNRLLPTTWLVRRLRRRAGPARERRAGPARERRAGPGRPGGRLRVLRDTLRLLNRIGEESYRQLLTWWYRRAGTLVLFDRHFYADFHATDVTGAGRPWHRRLHGAFLSRLYPRPDLVIYLDAPARLLHARKGEGTVASLGVQRRRYEALAASGLRFVRVDASRPLERVVRDAEEAIRAYAGELASGLDRVA
jgi:thymidylate kinase